MSANTVRNIEALRDAMRNAHVDAIIIPGTDPHQSEYVCEHWKIRDWVTGFTGSNGTAVVTLDNAGLWTDSRYYLQAEEQLKDTGVTLYKEDMPGEPSITAWLADNMPEDGVLGINGMLFSLNKANELEEFCGMQGFRLAVDFDPFDAIWDGRPQRPETDVFIHTPEFSGEDAASKISRVMEAVSGVGAGALFIPSLDEIAWLFNIRGADIPFNPVSIAYAYVSDDKKIIFIDKEKLSPDVVEYFRDNGIEIRDYESVKKFLGELPSSGTIVIDPNVVSDTLSRVIECDKVYAKSPVGMFKACKNDVQIDGVHEAMVRDGVALVKLFMWIERKAPEGDIKETDVSEKGKEFRSMHPYYKGDSFGMICGYKEHGAIVHYSANDESASVIKNDGLLLVDTGAQYIDGTTDITRTVALGVPSPQERKDYTLVLKGHIALASQIFPEGTRGSQLDVLARQFLWNEGLAYYHGTGHGIGHFLNVHEGPQNIRLNENPTPLKPGMITSDEPGVYKAGQYGIRIENLVLTVPAVTGGEFGNFLKFETLTLFPYDSKLIDKQMLSEKEIDWINCYHKTVREKLTPHLDKEEAEWLAEKTKTI
jgi:hypothetical protein